MTACHQQLRDDYLQDTWTARSDRMMEKQLDWVLGAHSLLHLRAKARTAEPAQAVGPAQAAGPVWPLVHEPRRAQPWPAPGAPPTPPRALSAPAGAQRRRSP